MTTTKIWTLVVCLPALTMGLTAATLQVGPGQPYAKPCAAIAAAMPGDTILIDATGSYNGDVCTWSTNDLTIQGVNGRPHIDANSKTSNNKGIWVLEGDNNIIENVELSGAVSTNKNGAAVRLEGSGLTLRQVYFHNNQNGILANNVQSGEILIEYSEFAANGAGDGQSHNIYVGRVEKFTLQYCYSHSAHNGHLVKSRAASNYILFNRLSSEGSNTSYEIDIPNGGLSYVVGNVIQQGLNDPNATLLSYLEEGTNAFNMSYDLFVVNNTFVNALQWGTFVKAVEPANPVTITNNIFSGAGTLTNQSSAILANNTSGVDPLFVNPSAYDYHLKAGSPAIDAGVDPGMGLGVSLLPVYEYLHRDCGEVRNRIGTIDAGAFEYAGAGTALACGISAAPPGLSSLSLSPTTVIGGSNSILTVSLTNAAPAGGITVALSSSDATVASAGSSITVPAGSYSATRGVNTGGVTAATAVTLTGAYAGVNKSTRVTVTPAATLAGEGVLPATVGGGKTSKVTVTLTSAAPSGGIVVLLTSSNTAVAPVPSSVTIPAGATSASVTVTTTAVTTATTVSITASSNNVTKTATLTINPASLSNVTISPSSIVGGKPVQLTLNLTAVAPAGGIVVGLASSASSVASVPSSVTVPAGASSVSVPVSTTVVTAAHIVTITATFRGVSASDTLIVEALFADMSLSATSATGGNPVTLQVTLNAAAPSGGVYIALNSSDTTVVKTPASVFVAAGATSGKATLTTSAVSTSTTITIKGSYAGCNRTETLAVN